MRKQFATLVMFVALLGLSATAIAQNQQEQDNIVPCHIGAASVMPSRTPAEGWYAFTAPKGGIVVMDFRIDEEHVHQDICRLQKDLPSHAPAPGSSGRPYDDVSGNNYDPIDWAIPLPEGWIESLRGRNGKDGKSASVEVVATVTGLPGTPARVINRSQDPSKAELTFVVPAGRDGKGCQHRMEKGRWGIRNHYFVQCGDGPWIETSGFSTGAKVTMVAAAGTYVCRETTLFQHVPLLKLACKVEKVIHLGPGVEVGDPH